MLPRGRIRPERRGSLVSHSFPASDEFSNLASAEPYCSPCSCPSCFHLAVARLGRGDQGIDQSARGSGDFLDGTIKHCAVGLGRAVESAELPDELEGRVSNLLVRRGWLKVKKRLDVSAHDS